MLLADGPQASISQALALYATKCGAAIKDEKCLDYYCLLLPTNSDAVLA